MKKIAVIFIILYYSAFSQRVQIKPDIAVDNNKVRISFNTHALSSKATLYYTKDFNDLSLPFPDYFYKISNNNIDSVHVFYINESEFNAIYSFRVTAIITNTFNEVRSKNYKFRIIGKDSQKCIGLLVSDGPFISMITNGSATFSFSSNLPCRAEVEYSEDIIGAKSIVITGKEDNDLQTKFILSANSLKPNSKYRYSVKLYTKGDEIRSGIYHFTTAPENDKPYSFRFAVLSDSRGGIEPDIDARLNGVNYSVLNKLILKIRAENPALTLFAGDLVGGQNPDKDNLRIQYSTWKDAVFPLGCNKPIYTSIGNHDALGYQLAKDSALYDPPTPESNEDIWADELTLPMNGPENEKGYPTYKENVYSFDYGDVHFVCLNSDYYYCYVPKKYIINDPYAVQIDHRQRKWLINDLEKNMNKRIIVFYHSPAYPAGGHIGSGLDRLPKVRDEVISIFQKYKVKLIFNGHEHNYSRTIIDSKINKDYKNSIIQIIAGRAGAPSYAQDMKNPVLGSVQAFSRKNHFMLVSVLENKILVQAVDESGNVFDEFEVK